jgi:ABC-type multidrug transport system ATPase subunit
LIFFRETPACGSGRIGVYPPTHPATIYLWEQSEAYKSSAGVHPVVEIVTKDFEKDCVDLLYNPSDWRQLPLIGCINFSKLQPVPQPFPTQRPESTQILEYDVFAMTAEGLVEPLNRGDYYNLESNPGIEKLFCGYEYLSAVNNLASTAVLHHYGLYSREWTQPGEPMAVADGENGQNGQIFVATSTNTTTPVPKLSQITTTISSTESVTEKVGFDGNMDILQSTLPKHGEYGPLLFNTRLMESRNVYRDHGKVYNAFLAAQSITAILFLPLFLLIIIPYTYFKQNGQIALLLINGVSHFSIFCTMLIFSLMLGLVPMVIYTFLIFIWWDFVPTFALIFLYILYYIAATSFVLMIGAICNRVRPAVQLLIGLFAVFSFMSFFVDDLPFYFCVALTPLIFQFTYALVWKTLILFITHSSTLSFSYTFASQDGISYFECVFLLILNTIITCGLSLYFQQVIPSQGIVAKPWDFVFDLSMWSLQTPTAGDISDYQQGNGDLVQNEPQLSHDQTQIVGGGQSLHQNGQQGSISHQYLVFSPPKFGRLTNKSDSIDQGNIGSYTQYVDEEERGEFLDDLGQREKNQNNQNQPPQPTTDLNLDDIDMDEAQITQELVDRRNGYGYLPPLHPYQPLTHYEIDNIQISLQNVRKTFRSVTRRATHAIKNISLDISRQIVVIIGKNGSGKSTFLQLLTGLALPTSGNIKITLPNRSTRFTNLDTIDNFNATHDSISRQSPATLDPFATDLTTSDPFPSESQSNPTQDQTNGGNSPQGGNGQQGMFGQFFDALSNTIASATSSSSSSNSPRPLFGYCPQQNSLFPWLTVKEQLHHMSLLIEQSYLGGDMCFDEGQRERIITDVISRLGLNAPSIINSKTNTLPPGIQRRISIAIATLHHPSIILLDDPLASLDLYSQNLLMDYLQHLKQLGSTIIMTSNNINQVDFADKLGIISNGNLLLYGSPAYLKGCYNAGYTLEITKVDNDDVFADLLQQSTTTIITSPETPDNTTTSSAPTLDQTTISKSMFGISEKDILTTKSGQKIFDALQSQLKFNGLCHLTYDSNHESTYIIEQGTALTSVLSNSKSNLGHSGSFGQTLGGGVSQSAIPALVGYLESQKSQLGIKSIKLSMKTLEDVFLAANQGKSTLRVNKNVLAGRIAPGTLPELAKVIEEREANLVQNDQSRQKIAKLYNTNVDDNNTPHAQLRTAGGVGKEKVALVGGSDSSENWNEIDSTDINRSTHTDLDSNNMNNNTTGFGEDGEVYRDLTPVMDNKFELWRHPLQKQPLESLLLTQIVGHLRKDYQILWGTPTKFWYLVLVPVFICISIFFVAPHDVILSTSSQPLSLTLNTMPSLSPIEMGISIPVVPINSVEFANNDSINPSTSLSPNPLSLGNLDFLHDVGCLVEGCLFWN